MVIQPNLNPDAASLQNTSTPAKPASRAAGSDAAANQSPSVDASTALVLAGQTPAVAGAEINDPAAADQALNFLQDNIVKQPALALLAQANQIPASVLQLLQP